MKTKTDLLHALLIDLRDRGSERIEKRKLLWMLGRNNESYLVWKQLLDEWEELGGKRNALHGFEWGPYIILTMREVDSIEDKWAVQ